MKRCPHPPLLQVMTSEKKIKRSGVLRLRENGVVSLRVKAVAGILSAEQLETLARTARDYGQGEVCTTARLNLEVPGVARADVADASKALYEAGLVLGSTGPTVRSIVACKGTICRHGCCDTFALARALEEVHGGRRLPRKLKIAIAGCPNNCARVQLNDIGFMGHRFPRFDAEVCTRCGACETVCREGAIAVTDDGIVFSPERCIGCGDCITACPANAISIAYAGLSLSLGGRAGREIRLGTEVRGLVSEVDVPLVTRRIISYFVVHAREGERFVQMMDRLGEETVLHELGLDA